MTPTRCAICQSCSESRTSAALICGMNGGSTYTLQDPAQASPSYIPLHYGPLQGHTPGHRDEAHDKIHKHAVNELVCLEHDVRDVVTPNRPRGAVRIGGGLHHRDRYTQPEKNQFQSILPWPAKSLLTRTAYRNHETATSRFLGSTYRIR